MCVAIENDKQKMTGNSNKKIGQHIKQLLKQLFKLKQKNQQLELLQNLENSRRVEKADSLESLESLENQRNAAIEASECVSIESFESLENKRNADIESSECVSLESYENDANERLLAAASTSASISCEMEDFEFDDITTVPVHFVRTAHGTFFWTATSELPSDNDLIQPLYCCTSNQIAFAQPRDRWAQA